MPDPAGSCPGIPGSSPSPPARLASRTWDICNNAFPELLLPQPAPIRHRARGRAGLAIARLISPGSCQLGTAAHPPDLPAGPAGCESGCHRLPGTCNSKGPGVGWELEHICPRGTAHLAGDTAGTAALLAPGSRLGGWGWAVPLSLGWVEH